MQNSITAARKSWKNIYLQRKKYLYEVLKNGYCNGCTQCTPMPKDWKWSLKWQQEKDKKRTPEFQKFIDAVKRNSIQIKPE